MHPDITFLKSVTLDVFKAGKLVKDEHFSKVVFSETTLLVSIKGTAVNLLQLLNNFAMVVAELVSRFPIDSSLLAPLKTMLQFVTFDVLLKGNPLVGKDLTLKLIKQP